ncbi:MAG: PRC-barrel domain-containing protein [Chloroflexota bacterium]|nr:PRC-barrel domain-containing protein [Chloroflexota bacterium]
MALIRAASLRGLPVIDAELAEQIGRIDEAILDCGEGEVAGFTVRSGGSFLETQHERLIPGSAVVGIGPDAVVVGEREFDPSSEERLRLLPRLSQLAGRSFLTRGGKRLGSLRDALVQRSSGRILGYPLDGFIAVSWLDRLFPKARGPVGVGACDYVRADGDLHFGRTLVVVPLEAVVRGADLADDAADQTERDGALVRWSRPPPSSSDDGQAVASADGFRAHP